MLTADFEDITCTYCSTGFVIKTVADELLGNTGIYIWIVIEPAVEVLSVSLPSMAPFLHGRKVLADLRTYFRSLLSTRRSSESKTRHIFYNMDESSDKFAPNNTQWKSTTAALQNVAAVAHFPLQSIVVKRDLEQEQENLE